MIFILMKLCCMSALNSHPVILDPRRQLTLHYTVVLV